MCFVIAQWGKCEDFRGINLWQCFYWERAWRWQTQFMLDKLFSQIHAPLRPPFPSWLLASGGGDLMQMLCVHAWRPENHQPPSFACACVCMQWLVRDVSCLLQSPECVVYFVLEKHLLWRYISDGFILEKQICLYYSHCSHISALNVIPYQCSTGVFKYRHVISTSTWSSCHLTP